MMAFVLLVHLIRAWGGDEDAPQLQSGVDASSGMKILQDTGAFTPSFSKSWQQVPDYACPDEAAIGVYTTLGNARRACHRTRNCVAVMQAAKKGDSACIGNISSVGTFVLCSLPRLEKLAGSCVHVVDAPRMYYYDRETGNCGDDANAYISTVEECESAAAQLAVPLVGAQPGVARVFASRHAGVLSHVRAPAKMQFGCVFVTKAPTPTGGFAPVGLWLNNRTSAPKTWVPEENDLESAYSVCAFRPATDSVPYTEEQSAIRRTEPTQQACPNPTRFLALADRNLSVSTCNDLDACSVGPRGGCALGCTTHADYTARVFTCMCPPGLLVTDSGSCADINECESTQYGVNGGCSSTCTNTLGSYVCECPVGFTKSSDGLSCECPVGFAKSSDGLSCECPVGFSKSIDGLSCIFVRLGYPQTAPTTAAATTRTTATATATTRTATATSGSTSGSSVTTGLCETFACGADGHEKCPPCDGIPVHAGTTATDAPSFVSNVCTCVNGSPATGDDCEVDGTKLCIGCDVPFVLETASGLCLLASTPATICDFTENDCMHEVLHCQWNVLSGSCEIRALARFTHTADPTVTATTVTPFTTAESYGPYHTTTAADDTASTVTPTAWGGTCANGILAEAKYRTQHNQCSSCFHGYELTADIKDCVPTPTTSTSSATAAPTAAPTTTQTSQQSGHHTRSVASSRSTPQLTCDDLPTDDMIDAGTTCQEEVNRTTNNTFIDGILLCYHAANDLRCRESCGLCTTSTTTVTREPPTSTPTFACTVPDDGTSVNSSPKSDEDDDEWQYVKSHILYCQQFSTRAQCEAGDDAHRCLDWLSDSCCVWGAPPPPPPPPSVTGAGVPDHRETLNTTTTIGRTLTTTTTIGRTLTTTTTTNNGGNASGNDGLSDDSTTTTTTTTTGIDGAIRPVTTSPGVQSTTTMPASNFRSRWCPASFPFPINPSTGGNCGPSCKGVFCYKDASNATAGEGPCGSWCQKKRGGLGLGLAKLCGPDRLCPGLAGPHVEFDGKIYGTLAKTDPHGTGSYCQGPNGYYLPLPVGTILAPDTPAIRTNVVAKYGWDTEAVVLASGVSYYTGLEYPGVDLQLPATPGTAHRSGMLLSSGDGYAVGACREEVVGRHSCNLQILYERTIATTASSTSATSTQTRPRKSSTTPSSTQPATADPELHSSTRTISMHTATASTTTATSSTSTTSPQSLAMELKIKDMYEVGAIVFFVVITILIVCVGRRQLNWCETDKQKKDRARGSRRRRHRGKNVVKAFMFDDNDRDGSGDDETLLDYDREDATGDGNSDGYGSDADDGMLMEMPVVEAASPPLATLASASAVSILDDTALLVLPFNAAAASLQTEPLSSTGMCAVASTNVSNSSTTAPPEESDGDGIVTVPDGDFIDPLCSVSVM